MPFKSYVNSKTQRQRIVFQKEIYYENKTKVFILYYNYINKLMLKVSLYEVNKRVRNKYYTERQFVDEIGITFTELMQELRTIRNKVNLKNLKNFLDK